MKVHDLGALEHVADLLSVGPDVLNQGRARLPRNVGQVFDAPPVVRDGALDHVVPGLSGVDPQGDGVGVFIDDGHPAVYRMRDEPVESAVADQDVAAPAQDEDSLALGSRKLDGLAEIAWTLDIGEMARRSPNLERRIGFQEFMVSYFQVIPERAQSHAEIVAAGAKQTCRIE